MDPIPANAIQNIYLQQESAIARMSQMGFGQSAEIAKDVHLGTDVDYDQHVAYSDRENDDAMLHYDPDNFGTHQHLNHLSQSSSSSLSSFLGIPSPPRPLSPLIPDEHNNKSKGTVKKNCGNPPIVLSPRRPSTPDSDPPIQARPSPTKKGKEPRSKQTSTETIAAATKSTKLKRARITDEELFAHLKNSILQDTQLYLRVLCYEVRLSILFLFWKIIR